MVIDAVNPAFPGKCAYCWWYVCTHIPTASNTYNAHRPTLFWSCQKRNLFFLFIPCIGGLRTLQVYDMQPNCGAKAMGTWFFSPFLSSKFLSQTIFSAFKPKKGRYLMAYGSPRAIKKLVFSLHIVVKSPSGLWQIAGELLNLRLKAHVQPRCWVDR